MLDKKTFEKQRGWSGYRLECVVWLQTPTGTLEPYLKPRSRLMHCQRGCACCREVYETVSRRVPYLPLFELRVVLVVPRRRLWCGHGASPQLVCLMRLDRYQRLPNRLVKPCGWWPCIPATTAGSMSG